MEQEENKKSIHDMFEEISKEEPDRNRWKKEKPKDHRTFGTVYGMFYGGAVGFIAGILLGDVMNAATSIGLVFGAIVGALVGRAIGANMKDYKRMTKEEMMQEALEKREKDQHKIEM